MLSVGTKTALCAALVAVVIPATTVAMQRGTRSGASVSGIGQQLEIDCRGQRATVSGTDHRITFVGDCPSLSVSGMNNTVSVVIPGGGGISVSGSNNNVRWQSTGNGRPSISVTGSGNRVTRAQ